MKNNTKFEASSILKTDGVIYAQPDDTVAQAVSKFQSSHDAAFVVDEEQKLLGTVTPYHLFIKRTYPPSTKLKNCFYHPAKIHLNMELGEIARLMLESKVHYLPIVDDASKMLGIATARRLLRKALSDPRSSNPISVITQGKDYLQTVNAESNLEEAIRFFEQSRRMKLVVVNRANHLVGVLPFFDLIPLFMKAKVQKEHDGLFEARHDTALFGRYKVENFTKKETIHVNASASIVSVLNHILDLSIGSVVVMRDKFTPENIVTTSDLLRYFYL